MAKKVFRVVMSGCGLFAAAEKQNNSPLFGPKRRHTKDFATPTGAQIFVSRLLHPSAVKQLKCERRNRTLTFAGPKAKLIFSNNIFYGTPALWLLIFHEIVSNSINFLEKKISVNFVTKSK